MQTELRDFQIKTVDWMIQKESRGIGGLLMHEQGLGKTLCVIGLLAQNKHQGTLVICPSGLVRVWEKEIENHSNLGQYVQVYYGSDRNELINNESTTGVYITSYNIISNEFKKYNKIKNKNTFLNQKFNRVILDEAHVIRNRKSQMFRSITEFIQYEKMWILTATPIFNGIDDIYPFFKLLDIHGVDTIQEFREIVPKSSAGVRNANRILYQNGLRYMKKEVLENFPEKKEIIVTTCFSTLEQQFYDALYSYSGQRLLKIKEIRDSLSSKDTDLKQLYNSCMLVLILRLKQCCNTPKLILQTMERIKGQDMTQAVHSLKFIDTSIECPVCLDNSINVTFSPCGHKVCEKCADRLPNKCWCRAKINYHIYNTTNGTPTPKEKCVVKLSEVGESSKIKKLLEIISERIERNEKIVIVSQWTQLIDLLVPLVRKRFKVGVETITGQVPINNRMHIINKFQTDSVTKVLFVSLNSSSEGITLTAANTLVHIDQWWNAAKQDQMSDRIHRIGQTKDVEINTIEDMIAQLIRKKDTISRVALTKDENKRIKLENTGWIDQMIKLIDRSKLFNE
jgi:SNF2 family DNA or RNA helicase